MPWKTVFFLAILAFVVFFAGFNISNVSDISFGFVKIEGVPIFISLFVAFLIGALVMLPLITGRKKRKSINTRKGKSTDETQATLPEPEAVPEIDPVHTEAASPRFKKNKK